ncbi:leucine-rich repeat protein [Faecalibacterium sp. 4P15]|uniref:leucine-rich repeat protein n=1 Tax=Faecalibacterium duncaniae (strain DSM 17677 / JCM 31915 / A2-165) TaxID=411483 RepID=UPI00164A50CD|nr:leucine-rich repeat protein [Faecalibacterium duncaniae]MBC5720196.1 leucine-rich repeat protein [Faecalibacterium duncaniae]
MRPKRLISLLVAVCMMITMLPLSAVTAFAADTSTVHEANDGEGIYRYAYKENEDGETVTITEFLGPVDPANPGPYDIDIPEKLDGFTVTGLGRRSFSTDDHYSPLYDIHHTQIQSVTIPESVTSIGDSAFAACRNLNSLTIKDAATSIGNRAFTECPLTTTLSLGKKITTIGDEAFYYCLNLKSVTIPQSVTSIGDYAFGECVSLKTLSFGENSFGENIETNIKTIGNYAFNHCNDLESVTIPQSVTSIGREAFRFCNNMKSLAINGAIESMGTGAFAGCISLEKISLGENIKTIGYSAFASCTSINLTNVTIPENVTTIRPGTFDYCTHLEYITLPAGLTSFQDSLKGCPAGNPNGAIYYNNYKAAADALLADNDDNSNIDDNHKLRKRNFLYLCKVTFDANGGKLNDDAEVPVYKTEKITNTKANELTAIHDPTRAGYKFTGWYTKDDQLFKVDDTEIMEDITLHAGWDFDPNASGCHPLTLKDGVITSVTVPGKNGADPEDITEIVKKNANEDGSFNVPEGATVSVAFDKDAFADSGLKFGHWDITGLDDPNAYQDKESFAFVMPAKAVTLKAMTQDASIEDDEPDIVGPIVIGTTVVVGGAVLGYQAYSLGAEFAGKLMALPYFPSNRSALAMMLWEDAGKPMPESELLYPDVGQEERDMDLQHAARWAMENELIPDLNDEGTAPEEMKFYPDNTVSKIDVLKAWQKAQELKNN